MRTRCFPEHNYKAFFINGKTIRIKLDPEKPITNLRYPEFYDVKITDYCTGKCPYCYQNSGEYNPAYADAFDKLEKYFGGMSKNQRPFQVAIGGGNPNQHVDFISILSLFHCLDIVPNYTTNGIGINSEIIDATKKYCGGVAVSCHPHLQWYWAEAVNKLKNATQCNLHIIISDKQSIDYFCKIYKIYKDVIKYFVLLPYEAAGRATKKEIDYKYLTETLSQMGNIEQVAFGANFYRYLCFSNFKLSLYEPEIYSKFLDVKDMKIYNSSFNLVEPKYDTK
jgi:hypothetical protein